VRCSGSAKDCEGTLGGGRERGGGEGENDDTDEIMHVGREGREQETSYKRTSRSGVLVGGVRLLEGGADVEGDGELFQGFGRFLLLDKRENLLSRDVATGLSRRKR
jgi:hypothetical protein